MKADGESGENRGRVGAAVTAQGLVHMFEAALHRYPVAGKQRKLGRAVRQAFQSGQPIDRRHLADGVHLGVNVERRQAGGTLVEVGDALAELCPDIAE